MLNAKLKDWKISEVCGGITDNGVNAIGLMGIEHFPCFAHTLQLSIKNGLQIPRVQRVIARCKKLVEHFTKSTKETYSLREKQEMLKLPQHKLIQDCLNTKIVSTQTYSRLCYPLGQHTRHAGKTNGVAGSHCSSLDEGEGEVFDARGR